VKAFLDGNDITRAIEKAIQPNKNPDRTMTIIINRKVYYA
jgi:hypothetical protein